MTVFPDAIRQGDTVAWRTGAWRTPIGDEISSANGWALITYVRFPIATGATQSTGVSYGDGWQSSLSSGITALFPLGYRGSWQAVASKSGDVYTIGTGAFDVLANLSAASAVDGRSQARRDLEACQVAIRDIIAKGGTQEYALFGNTRKYYKLSELIELENKLKADVVREEAAENIKNGKGNPYNVFVRFT